MLASAGPNGITESPVPSKRRSRGASAGHSHSSDIGDERFTKRVKAEANGHSRSYDASSKSHADSLVDVLSDFSIAVNELFQLKEYASLVEWDPRDFSRVDKADLPEIFEYFVKVNSYTLIWDEQSLENMSDLPLRLQKKKLLDRETILRQKYPFMDDVLQRSLQRENDLLVPFELGVENPDSAPARRPKTKSAKSNGHSSTKSSRPASKQQVGSALSPAEIKSESEEIDVFQEYDFSNLDTNYKLRSVKYSVPPPVVTHPSHIPSWRPLQGDAGIRSSDQDADTIIPYEAPPIEVVSARDNTLRVPQIESKLETYLREKYKAGIIDDGGVEVGNTPDEYEATLRQQTKMLKRLYEKVMVEERFELNGEKIERRKVMLPNGFAKHSSDFFRENGSIVPKIQGAANDQTFQDHLVAQGMAFSRVHQGIRKQHQAKTRRIAQIIEQHFRKKAGEKERLAREQELNLRRLSRLAIQAVRKRWSQANRVYRFLQQEKEEELKQIEGREHLSKMLEHSTQLLEAQLNKSSRENTEFETSNVESDSDSSENNSDEMSSDEDEDENEAQSSKFDGKPDSELSVSQLREKYASMRDSSEAHSDSKSAGDGSGAENGSDENGDAGLASLYGGGTIATPSNISADYDEEQLKLIKSLSEKPDQEMLDSDDFTDSMEEDDMSSSDLDSDDDTEANAAKGGLHGDQSEHKLANGSFGVDGEQLQPMNGAAKIADAPESFGEEDNLEEINGFKVKDVPLPSLLRGTLRPYQKQGLNWLASLYNNNTNGILADEMGLGKTIQTISLLSYLACEHHIWGPHLIIVPTSVMLNWEMEFKKFAPGFKVLTYYGSPQERARKRKGWNKQDAFHVCITSYQLVVHDHSSFKRKKWRYMILDEAHNIKNFRSTRWKALLNFNTENRLLLTGTPLQNNLMELWSLLYFLMPSSKVEQMMPEGFANFEDFQQWFGKPVDKILEKTATGDVIDENVTDKLDKETKDTVSRLHQVLRPYLLRRLKKDVEKQMPGKYEHIIYCRLSKRQRYLYDDFMSRAKTKETLASGNFLSIINCLMQLRKVCNHPDLFEVRPIVTSFAMPSNVTRGYNSVDQTIKKLLRDEEDTNVSLSVLNAYLTDKEDMNYFAAEATSRLMSNKDLEEQIEILDNIIKTGSDFGQNSSEGDSINDIVRINRSLKLEKQMQLRDRLRQNVYVNTLRCQRKPIFGHSLFKLVANAGQDTPRCESLKDMILDIPKRQALMSGIVNKYAVITPAVVALDMKDELIPINTQYKVREEVQRNHISNPFHQAQVKLSIAFPDKQLLQYDCGKLQKLATLLQDLVPNGHRALIFTQMTKVLDILEQFLNIHGYRYMRLDGATKIEDRQLLTEKFNRDPKIPVFILSTRSGGLGINLTGADTVIFYDSDWNPAMDKQCQDRCHRIGQSRDVHIYRFVSEYTIESNILKKANQKRQLDNVVIQEGDFTTDYLGKFSVRDLVNDASIISELPDKPIGENANVELLAQAEDEADRNAAKEAMKEVAVDDEDFTEESKQGTPAPKKGPNDMDTADEDFEEGVGHIDEYMLRCIADGHYVE
ncbi:hypothetical protein OXX80_005525 [Metschnikowia pulcherrima]